MKFLTEPINNASLIFFRIVFGGLMFGELMGMWTYYHFYKNTFDPSRFHFKYWGWDWIPVMGDPWMSIFFIGVLTSSIGVMLGWKYRLNSILLFLGFSFAFLMEKILYLNHGYFAIWLCFVMMFLPANRDFSIDAKQNPAIYSNQTPRWTILILCFLMSVVYFFGGIAKWNPDWLNATPLNLWLGYKAKSSWLGSILSAEWLPWFMSYGGIFLDLSVVWLLIWKPTRKIAFGMVLFFHLTNVLIFNIGIFPWMSIALSSLFFPSDWPQKAVHWAGQKIAIIRKWSNQWQTRTANWTKSQTHLQPKAWLIPALVIIALFHVTYPLRHNFIAGDVAWTEEGHRYSWRMMLRAKQGHIKFTVINGTTGEKSKIKVKDYLSTEQYRKMTGQPDMILEFARYLEKIHQDKGWTDIEIYADAQVKLNAGKYHKIVDAKADLTKVSWHPFKHNDWITHRK